MRGMVLVAGVLVATSLGAQQYDVYAIRYATIPQFPVSGLVKGAEESRKLDIAMMVWLIRGGGRNVLVDSGFYRPQFFKSWTVTEFVRPDQAAALAGVKPEEITDVVLTHTHWDHADGAHRLLGCWVARLLSKATGSTQQLSNPATYLDKRLPIAQTFDSAANLAAQDRMKEIVKEVRFIVPGHDPAVFTRFPRVSERVVRIE